MYLGDILFEVGQIQLFNYLKCMSEKEFFIYFSILSLQKP